MHALRVTEIIVAAAPVVTAREGDTGELQLRATALIASLPPQGARDLTRAMIVLDHPLTALVYAGSLIRFSRQTSEKAARQLRRMAVSRIPLIRSIAVATRRAAAAIVYAGAGAASDVMEGR